MGELILCHGTLAAMPFFLESISVNIYSLEELVSCMREQPYPIGMDICCIEFTGWVRQELKQEKLADVLQHLVEHKAGLIEFASMVLSAVGYFDKQEREEIIRELQEYVNKTPFECEILKADSLLASGKYKSSIAAYEALTKRKPESKREELLLGKIWHNMGTAYARLFFFEQAADCYQKAYELNQSQVTAKALLSAHASIEGEFGTMPENPGFLKEWNSVQEAKEQGDSGTYQKRLFYIVEEWKKEYTKGSRDR